MTPSNAKPLILITGAAGKTGAATVRELLALGYPVRAMVRQLDSRAETLRRAGANIVVGNMLSLDETVAAMGGVRRAYFVAPWEPHQLHLAMNFAVAAADARLEATVVISQWLSQSRHPSLATRETFLTDRVLALLPDTAVTTINVGWFADNYMAVLPYVAHLGLFPFPLGQGLNAPVSNEDIGRVIARVLAEPAPHAGRSYRPTGPELLRPKDLAAIYSQVFKRPVRHIDIPMWMFRKALRALGMPAHMQAQLRHYVQDYQRGAFAAGAPNDVVERVTGRPAEGFETIAARYAAADPALRPGLGNFVRALLGFMRIGMLPALNLAAYERSQHYPQFDEHVLSIDDAQWRRTHAERADANPPNQETALAI